MPTEFAADLDQWVASFENRWHATGKAVLSEHLPPRHHPLFERVLTELVCVDLEKHWEAGRRKRLDEYRYDFPELFANAELLQQAAFEEYRQRTQAGEPCTVEEYRLFAGIDTSNWPVQESLDGTIERPPTVIVQPTEIKHIEPAQLDELTDLRRSAPKLADRIHKAEEEFPDVGETFLGFELVSKIGQGSFAKVFLARQPQLADRLVALKVSALMLEEPRHLARMQHANIVPIYSVHCTKRLQAVCMPYLGAVTMSSVLEEMSSSGQIPQTGQAFLHTLYNNPSTLPYSTPSVKHMVAETPEVAESTRVSAPILEKLAQANHVETVLWLVARLADGLQHAHERDILHLDLKPANILLTDDGQPMLLDFNLSVEVAPESASEIARIGGTLPYMSPEQIESLRDNKFGVDARSDLFSLGVIFFEMITGQSPFIRRTGNRDKLLANMLADRTGPTPSARERNPAVPRAVDSILAKLLQPDRRHRYQTAAELREDIELQLSDRPLRHARDRSLGERFGKWRRRSPRLSTACLVGLAALVLLILPATAIAIRENQIAERNREIAVAEAKQMRFEVGKEAATIHVLLATLTGDRAQLSQGIERGQTVLDRYRIESNPNWFNESIVAHLPTEQQTQLRIELAEMLLLMADGQMILADDTPDRAAKKQQLEKALDWSRVAERCYPRDALPLGLVRQREQLRLKLPDLASSIDIPVGAVRSPEDSYRDGVAATMWGRHREAIEPLAEFAESHPKHFMAWFVLGVCQEALGQNAESESSWRVCIALEPDMPWAYFNRASVRFQLGNFPGANADLTRALAIQPNWTAALMNRAVARKNMGKYSLALEDLDKVLGLVGAPTRAWFLRAEVKELAGDPKGAQADRGEGMKHEPGDELSYSTRGYHRMEKEPHEALKDFDAALKINPRSREAMINKSVVLSESLQRPKEAIAVLDRFLECYPDNLAARAGRGVLLARIGEDRRARADAQECLKLDRRGFMQYQIAGLYAQLARHKPQSDARKQALALLAESLRNGFTDLTIWKADPDLEPVRSDPEFKRLQEVLVGLKNSPQN